jgi:hypothetical protein
VCDSQYHQIREIALEALQHWGVGVCTHTGNEQGTTNVVNGRWHTIQEIIEGEFAGEIRKLTRFRFPKGQKDSAMERPRGLIFSQLCSKLFRSGGPT